MPYLSLSATDDLFLYLSMIEDPNLILLYLTVYKFFLVISLIYLRVTDRFLDAAHNLTKAMFIFSYVYELFPQFICGYIILMTVVYFFEI